MTIADIMYYIEINTILQLTRFKIPENCGLLRNWYEKTMNHPVLKELDRHFADITAHYMTESFVSEAEAIEQERVEAEQAEHNRQELLEQAH